MSVTVQVLCYVLDFSGKGTDQAVEQYEALKFELECYKPGMTSRPSVIAANKSDLPHAQANFDYFQVRHRHRLDPRARTRSHVCRVSCVCRST
jgi:GTPase involved in cell partitioning and DNA repair